MSYTYALVTIDLLRILEQLLYYHISQKFRALTKELKFISRFSKGEKVFMRTTPTCIYDPPDLIPIAWLVNFWLIDANTLVLSLLLSIDSSNLKPNFATTELKH